MTTETQETILDRELTELFRTKYTTFAMSSNARAIPDARDGLKPVHRRILYETKQSAPKHCQKCSNRGQCLRALSSSWRCFGV